MMRLLSCHIENFGAITNTDYDFSAGITEFYEKNGTGKTTLASFIKAMFYGLPKTTSRSKDFNDRKHFYPFRGGKFGGNLSFEMEGRKYRIERYFDKSSETKDTCVVYCNESIVKEGDPFLRGEPGEAVFGIDKDSFERTVFITAAEFDSGSTDRINAKLNRYIEGDARDADFREAVTVLEKKAKELKAARGGNDRISRQQDAIADLNAKIANVRQVADGLPELYKKRHLLTEEIGALEQKVNAGQNALLLREKWDAYDRCIREAASEEQALAELRTIYPAGLPSEEELSQLRESAVLLTKKESAAENCFFADERQTQLNKLADLFDGNLPAANELEAVEARLKGISQLEQELLKLQAQENLMQENKALQGFPEREPDARLLDRIKNDLAQYKEKMTRLESLSGHSHETASKPGIILSVFALLLFAVGGVLASVSLLPGILTASAGAIFLVLGIVLFLTKRRKSARSREELAKLQAEADKLAESVRMFLMPYGYDSEDGIVRDFAMFDRDLTAFQNENIKYDALKTQLEEKQRLFARAADSVKSFLARYGIPDTNLQTGFLRLQQNIKEYQSLRGEAESFSMQQESLMKELSEEKQRYHDILSRYALVPEFGRLQIQIASLDAARRDTERLEENIRKLRERAAAYKEENNLEERPETELSEEAGEIPDLISERRRMLSNIDRQISEDENIAEKLPDLENKRDEAKELLAAYQERHKILSAAKEFLVQAEQNLKDQYVAPVMNKFSEYAEILNAVFEEKIRMDQEFHITFEGGGESRSEQHLSAGQRAMWMLCFRLALIDNLYEQESPFVVMDDPFVNLDEIYMENVRKLIGQLAGEKQILYFCCHESRKLLP